MIDNERERIKLPEDDMKILRDAGDITMKLMGMNIRLHSAEFHESAEKIFDTWDELMQAERTRYPHLDEHFERVITSAVFAFTAAETELWD